MESQQLTNLVALTLFSLMFSLGLSLTPAEATSLWKQPGLLLRSVLAVVILPPLVAIPAGLLLPEASLLRAVVLALAVAPGAPLSTTRSALAGGSIAAAASLQVTVSVLAVVTVPLWAVVYNAVFPATGTLIPGTIVADPLAVAKIVAVVQLIPIGIGILIRKVLPELANRFEPNVTKIANILFVALILVLLVNLLDLLLGVGYLPFLLAIPVMAIWLTLGHFLGGTDQGNRSVFAIASIARNIGLAILLLQLNLPSENVEEALPLVLVFLMVGFIAGSIYSVLSKKSMSQEMEVI